MQTEEFEFVYTQICKKKTIEYFNIQLFNICFKENI